jgi:hypothetical protein
LAPVEAQRLEQQEKQALQADSEALARWTSFWRPKKTTSSNNPGLEE